MLCDKVDVFFSVDVRISLNIESINMLIPHPWNLTEAEAIDLQNRLAKQVDTTTLIPLDDVRLVAGVDVHAADGISTVAVVVLTYPQLEIVETVTASCPTTFPYVSGLLSFREGKVILKAQKKLKLTPDVYLFDGAGIAHPRRIGIAAHLGLWLDAPTVGCGKTWLIGEYVEPERSRGSYSLMHHNGKAIGVVLRTRQNVKPVFISPGHLATLDSARELTLTCCPRYRLPEPIRAADHACRMVGKW
jgi:deoxyribonuclease V